MQKSWYVFSNGSYIILQPLFNNNAFRYSMMTSSNGNIFGVTGHLCEEFTGPRWIPRTKASDAEFDVLICVWMNDWVNNREAGDLRRYRAYYDAI